MAPVATLAAIAAPVAPAMAVPMRQPPPRTAQPQQARAVAPAPWIRPAAGTDSSSSDPLAGAVSQDVQTGLTQVGDTIRADMANQTADQRTQAAEQIAQANATAQVEQARINAQRDIQLAQIRAAQSQGNPNTNTVSNTAPPSQTRTLTILPDTSSMPTRTNGAQQPSAPNTGLAAPAGVPLWAWGLGAVVVGGAGYVLWRQSQIEAQAREQRLRVNPDDHYYYPEEPRGYLPQPRRAGGMR